jgi:hypothetical protein
LHSTTKKPVSRTLKEERGVFLTLAHAFPLATEWQLSIHCGHELRPLTIRLPATCDLDLPEARFAQAAGALRARPELVGELRWHRAAVAAYLVVLGTIEGQTRELQQAIDQS